MNMYNSNLVMWTTGLVLLLHLMGSFCQEGPRKWRLCYMCKGRFPDRECELYPKYVTRGPGRTNCTKDFCTSYVRYKPKQYLVRENQDGVSTTGRPLTSQDFEVDSIVRECEDFPRKNTCTVDNNKMGVTCYETCVTDFCNGDIPRPSEEDFARPLRPGVTGIPFPDVFDEEDERRKDGPFGGFPPRFPPPGFRPRGGEEEDDNQIDERGPGRRRFPGQYPPPFAGLIRPGEYPKSMERDFRAGPSGEFREGGDFPTTRQGSQRPEGPGRYDERTRIAEDRDKTEDRGIEELDDKPSTEPSKPTTPASTKPRRPNARGSRGRGQKTQVKAGEAGEAGETSKSQGGKSSAVQHLCSSLMILFMGLKCLI